MWKTLNSHTILLSMEDHGHISEIGTHKLWIYILLLMENKVMLMKHLEIGLVLYRLIFMFFLILFISCLGIDGH